MEVCSPSQLKGTRLGFLDLPAEVRNEIYTYLFRDAKLGLSTTHTSGPLCASFCSCQFPWAITVTNSRLRREALPLLLAATTLEVANRIDKTAMLPGPWVDQIPHAVILDAKLFNNAKFNIEKFTSLRVLELRNISVWCKYYEESYLESNDADECMFNLAMFNLRRISPSLIELVNCEKRRAKGVKVLLGCQFVGSSMRHETVQAIIDVDSHQILQKLRGSCAKDRNEWAGFY